MREKPLPKATKASYFTNVRKISRRVSLSLSLKPPSVGSSAKIRTHTREAVEVIATHFD
jgi:hypothetical protein